MRNKPDNLGDLLPRNFTFLIASLILYYGDHTSDLVMDMALWPNAIANTCSIPLSSDEAIIINFYHIVLFSVTRYICYSVSIARY